MESIVAIGNDNICDHIKDQDQGSYFNHLSTSRQLLVLEKAKLTQHVDRYGLMPITGESDKYKFKMEYQANYGLKSTKRSVLISTSSPRPHQNNYLPLLPPLVQGKRLIDTVPSKTFKINSKGRSLALTDRRDMNETIRFNLSRLPPQIKPTIPTIGRKAGKQTELTIHTQAIKTRQSSNQKAAGNVSKYRLRPLLAESPRLQITRPRKFKFDPLTEGDRIDMDFFNEYLLLCPISETPHPSDSNTNPTDPAFKKTPRGNKTSNAPTHVVSSSYSHPIPKVLYKSDSSLSFSKPFYTQYRLKQRPILDYLSDDDDDGDVEDNGDDDAGYKTSRMQIVVDMPNIILNTPSPEPDISRETTFVGILSRTCKESEIRQKEIMNLLDDVKELNKRCEPVIK